MVDTDLDAYITWINNNGGSFGKIQLIRDEVGDGRSVVATEAIEMNESFATVPFKLAITEPVARKAFPSLDQFSCRTVLTLFVAHQTALGTSFYAPYLNILPKTIKTPFYFDDTDMTYLEHTNIALAIRERLQTLREDYERLLQQPIGEDVKNLVNWDLFLWAHCAISSRSFPYKLIDPNHSDASEVLFPLVDSLNHKPNTKITWSRSGDAETGTLSFVSGQSFAAGEQVFNNYGPKSNEELLLGYGFCLENNEADHIALKPNITRDPHAQHKLAILQQCNISSGNTDPLTHYVHWQHVPDAYFKMMRVFVMNDTELHHYSNCTDGNRLNFVGFRNELAMLSVTSQLLQSRVFAMKSVQLNRDTPTWWQKYALMYRDGQERLYNNTLDIIRNHKFRVLNTMKSAMDSNNLPTTAPFLEILNPGYFGSLLENNSNISSFVPLESVTLTLKKLLDKDQEFKDTIDQLFEDIEEEEDVILMLALIRESTKCDSTWQSFIKKTQLDSARQRDDEAVMSLRDLYESLFPAFSDAFPDIFDPEVYTFENLMWAENIVVNYTIDNPLVVVPL